LVNKSERRDGIKETSALIGKRLCGDKGSFTLDVTPTSGVIYIKFHSDETKHEDIPHKGFKMTWEPAEKVGSCHPCAEPWSKKQLTYKITKYPAKKWELSDAVVDKEIAKAFKVWSDVANIKFTPVRNHNIDIEILWGAGDHGDGEDFDGEGGVLAHAYFPEIGDTHFDDHEKWTLKGDDGINLLQVAAHEFGHSLGLDHSKNQEALMAPFYAGYKPEFQLHDDDIARMRVLYGNAQDVSKDVSKKPKIII